MLGIAKQLGSEKDIDIPSASNVARMSIEVAACNYLLNATKLLNCEQSTLCWDAGTQDGKHNSDIYLMLDDRTKVNLSIAQLPGGQATSGWLCQAYRPDSDNPSQSLRQLS